MADGTHIEWTDATWNIVNGCSVLSPGCTNCYAMKLAGTCLKHVDSRKGLTIDTKAGPVWNGITKFNDPVLLDPIRWKRPRKIFVCAHGDLFHDSVPDEWIDKVFAVMALAPQHQFQVLTKRSARMREYLSDPVVAGRLFGVSACLAMGKGSGLRWSETAHRLASQWPLSNVWLGVSVEDQKRRERIVDLAQTPAAVRWISGEPLLEHLTLTDIPLNGGPDEHGIQWLFNALTGEQYFIDDPGSNCGGDGPDMRPIDWFVAGGESGPGARPMHPDWARALRDQCADAGVPFLFKQWGAWAPASSVDIYCHGPDRNKRAFPNSQGIAWLRDGRIAMRDFTVAEHRRRVRAGEAHNLRAVEEDWDALRAFHATIDDASAPDVGFQWMYEVGKKGAGRLLDGVEHNGYPS